MYAKIRVSLIAVLLMGAVVGSRPTAAEEPAPAAATSSAQGEAQLVEKGRTLYAGNCAHCHGFRMISAGSVAFDLRQFPHDQKPRFVQSVTNGKNGRMPAWGDLLSREEIDELWAYVKTGGE
jgi:mono/diheme cytochrome c family protein